MKNSHKATITIVNETGLHIRPATLLVKMLQGSVCSVQIQSGEDTVNARSIMGLLTLAARKGTHLTVTAEGVDAKQVMEKIVNLFNGGFGES